MYLCRILGKIWEKYSLKAKREERAMSVSDFVEKQLMRVGATPEYTGYKYLLQGLMMSMEDESLLTRVTTGIYPAIARRYGTGPANVERGIRTIISAIWEQADEDELKEIMGRSYAIQPGNAKFIGIFSKYLLISYRHAVHGAGRIQGGAAAGGKPVAKNGRIC